MTNAVLDVKFENNTYQFEVTWEDECFTEGEDIAERLFFSDEFSDAWGDGHPNMTVYLKDDFDIKSRVNFEQEAGMIYSTRKLSKLLEKKNA
jgi:hypothetical protein